MEKLLEPDPPTRVLRVTAAFNDVLYSSANEPSLGMYRIQEHVAVTVPKLVDQQLQLQENSHRVEGACYDLEYDTQTLSDMVNITQFRGIKNSLLRAIQLKQQLDEADMKRRMIHTPQATSHTPTLSPLPQPYSHSHSQTTPTKSINSGDDVDGSDDIITSVEETSENTEPQLSITPKSFD